MRTVVAESFGKLEHIGRTDKCKVVDGTRLVVRGSEESTHLDDLATHAPRQAVRRRQQVVYGFRCTGIFETPITTEIAIVVHLVATHEWQDEKQQQGKQTADLPE